MRRSAAELASAASAPRGCPRPRQVASGTDLQALIRHPGAATVPIGACSRSLPNGRSQLPLPRLVRSRDSAEDGVAASRPARVLARLRGGRFDVSGTLPEALEFLVPTTMCRSTPDRPPRRTLPALHKPLLQRSGGAPSASSTTQVLMPIHRHLAVTVHPHIHRTDHPRPRTPTPFTATCFEWILG